MRRAAAPHGSPLRGRIIGAMFKCPPVRVRCRAPCKVRLAPHLLSARCARKSAAFSCVDVVLRARQDSLALAVGSKVDPRASRRLRKSAGYVDVAIWRSAAAGVTMGMRS
jgi:hypothetical protein